MQLNKQELNRKLAEWAGFFYDEGAEYGIPPVFGLWYPPDNDHIGYPELPPFTQSLDACFRWLGPKLNDAQKARLPGVFSHEGTFTFHWFWDNPALALCLAIEKLIDSEARNAIS